MNTLVFAIVGGIVAYIAMSYPMLRKVGVRERLLERAISFGTVLFLLQFIPIAVSRIFGMELLGVALALAGSYYYVRSTLRIGPLGNLTIVLLPLVVMWSVTMAAALIWMRMNA